MDKRKQFLKWLEEKENMALILRHNPAVLTVVRDMKSKFIQIYGDPDT